MLDGCTEFSLLVGAGRRLRPDCPGRRLKGSASWTVADPLVATWTLRIGNHRRIGVIAHGRWADSTPSMHRCACAHCVTTGCSDAVSTEEQSVLGRGQRLLPFGVG